MQKMLQIKKIDKKTEISIKKLFDKKKVWNRKIKTIEIDGEPLSQTIIQERNDYEFIH